MPILTFHRLLTFFIWLKQHWVIGDYQIKVQEPYPYQNGAQTRHAKVLFVSITLHKYQQDLFKDFSLFGWFI